MSNLVYRPFKKQLVAAADAWLTSDIRCMLVDSSSTYSPSVDDTHLSDAISGGLVEVSTTGYTAGGVALTTKVVANLSTPVGAIGLQADNVAWLPLGGTGLIATAALIYVHTGTNSTSDLIMWIDSIGPFPIMGSNMTIAWSANGVLVID